MKTLRQSIAVAVAVSVLDFSGQLLAATTVTSTATAVVNIVSANTAIIPVPRIGPITDRQSEVLQRAKDNPGKCDVAFIGDSITQGWEGEGKNVWKKYYGKRKALNFGVSGDRTQHVLWRIENGQLDGIKPNAVVLMIGTNNSNGQDNTEADILEGVTAIVKQIHAHLAETKILIVGIFPRGEKFNAQRGKILQVNQALAKLADGKAVQYVDFGSLLIESDGSISKAVMPDYLHLSEAGYEIWAKAIEPKLKKILAD